jgi:flagellar biogenesis protein FliO
MEQAKRGANSMDILLLLGVIVLWFVLQAWILPKFGVST